MFGAGGIATQLINETKNSSCSVQQQIATEPKTATIKIFIFP